MSQSPSKYPDYFYKPPDNLFNPAQGQMKAFHLTQPDERLAKVLYSQGSNTGRRKNAYVHEAHSVQHIEGMGKVGPMHHTTFGRSPKSIAPEFTKGLMKSEQSIESTDTIRAFFAGQNGNKVARARRVVDKEEERVKRVAKVRENAMC